MSPAQVKRLQLLASALSVLLLLALVAVGWFYFQLRGSLPQLDGSAELPGLAAPVTVNRDALGVPTLRGQQRTDVAAALGFLHAQDRFFQMDLMRRRAAGELAALFGKAALPLDRRHRPHRFRALAREVLETLPPSDRALLESYTAGVNAGLRALDRRPFEYIVLRTMPELWQAEDSLLVGYTMILDLQDSQNTYERSLTTLRDRYGIPAVDFFAPLLSPDDAALDGSTAPLAPIPPARYINIREQPVASTEGPHTPTSPHDSADDFHPGSNSFALSGAHTATGAALLANDPHLNLSIPNIWYRAVLEFPAQPSTPTPDVQTQNPQPETQNSPASATATTRLVGATLPGLPLIIIGSNGHIAWGFTVAYADTNDLVTVDVNPISRSLYKFPAADALREIETRTDQIEVKGADPVTIESRWTAWGPILVDDGHQLPLAHRWIAHDPSALNLHLTRLETATTAREALDIARSAGIPAQNFLVADRHGDIGWTIAGRLPQRTGFDGRFPVSWSFGDRRWNGLLPPEKVPAILSSSPSAALPAVALAKEGRLWTANNRLVGGPALSILGDGGYASPARAAQIRDRLATLEQARPADLLDLALDDRALFLARWQQLALDVLTPDATAKNSARAKFRRLVETWNARASIDSVGYRLVREFRSTTAHLALTPIFARCIEKMPDFNWRLFHYEPALWTLVQEKPLHLLSARYETWDALLLAAIDATIARIEESGPPLERATWGDANRARIRHPFASVLPEFLTARLNLPPDPLPGDAHMPRIQSPSYGASLRLVVSPGREDEGIFHMPGGQSGHPLSPFYHAGHDAWLHGTPTPLLPGETRHTLTLTP
jgi:Protein related to penicillin acylase